MGEITIKNITGLLESQFKLNLDPLKEDIKGIRDTLHIHTQDLDALTKIKP